MVQSNHRVWAQAMQVGCVVTAPVWVYALLFSGDYDYTFALAGVPVIVLLNLALVFIVTRREPFLRQAMIGGTLLKVAASGIALYLCYSFGGGSDALHYFSVGEYMANGFWVRGEWPFMTPLWSTNLINTVTAYQVMLIPSIPTLFVLSALIAFWGLYLFYKAFCLSFPDGDRSRMVILLFFLPSVALWTATIGKDSLIALFIGMSAYGFAILRLRPGIRSYFVVAIGLIGTMAIRPHVAAMLGSSMIAPYLLGRNKRGVSGGVAKTLCVVLLIATSMFLVTRAGDFLQVSDFQQVPTALEHISASNRGGQSEFAAGTSLPLRIAMAPILLFRPLPWEVHNVTSAAAAMEGVFLLYLFWKARSDIVRMVRNWRENSYVLFVAVYAVEFCVAFAAASSNFGTLNRMRVMLLPFALFLLCGSAVKARSVTARAHAVALARAHGARMT